MNKKWLVWSLLFFLCSFMEQEKEKFYQMKSKNASVIREGKVFSPEEVDYLYISDTIHFDRGGKLKFGFFNEKNKLEPLYFDKESGPVSIKDLLIKGKHKQNTKQIPVNWNSNVTPLPREESDPSHSYKKDLDPSKAQEYQFLYHTIKRYLEEPISVVSDYEISFDIDFENAVDSFTNRSDEFLYMDVVYVGKNNMVSVFSSNFYCETDFLLLPNATVRYFYLPD